VLEPVIHDQEFHLPQGNRLVGSFSAVRILDHEQIGKPVREHQTLIVFDATLRKQALVTPGHHPGTQAAAKALFRDITYQRGFSGSPHGQVSHADNPGIHAQTFKNREIIEEVPQTDQAGIYQGECKKEGKKERIRNPGKPFCHQGLESFLLDLSPPLALRSKEARFLL